MSKLTREEKKAEEARVIAEMEEAMQENANATPEAESEPQPTKRWSAFEDATPENLHCRRCHTLMENGVCPTCGFKVYVPMDEKKRNKIRLIVGGVCVAAFLIWFLITQLP